MNASVPHISAAVDPFDSMRRPLSEPHQLPREMYPVLGLITGSSTLPNRASLTPKWQASASGEYTTPLSSRYDGLIAFDYTYQDMFNSGLGQLPQLQMPSYRNYYDRDKSST
ncbi:hypothetical protein [Sphingobium sp. LB126]|uniref:hypothetical protein n=1 Tax=Sphingobium sp. LB126 TaxID=1983755 RepID=UPI0012FE219D|nr:hypothetical protein [Sphingobium sp. LB126]